MTEQVLRRQLHTTQADTTQVTIPPGQSNGHAVSLRAVLQATTAALRGDSEEASERRWDALFAASQDTLAKLADKAISDYLAGRTTPLDPDRL